MRTVLPNALAEIAAGRDHIKTDEFARATNAVPQTVRKNYCLTGECYGIRPIKIGNRLNWPVAAIATLLGGEVENGHQAADVSGTSALAASRFSSGKPCAALARKSARSNKPLTPRRKR